MTKLLQRAIAQIEKLPEGEQAAEVSGRIADPGAIVPQSGTRRNSRCVDPDRPEFFPNPAWLMLLEFQPAWGGRICI